MIRAYAVADVRAVEDAAMAQLPEGELMSRAARGLAKVVRSRLRERDGTRVVALVGGGNNGADALYAVARLARGGFAAAAVLTGAGPVHSGARADAEQSGVVLLDGSIPGDPAVGWAAAIAQADVVVEGITGIGGRPGLREEARRWVSQIRPDTLVVAVDLPSGADPAGLVGVTDADAVMADETVTFGECKPVHLLPGTERACGRLTVVDIGLDFGGCLPVVERLTPEDVRSRWPVPGPGDHKYTRGVLGVVAGSSAYPGAAVLSVLGALGTGPGMVRYYGPDDVRSLVLASAPEVVTVPGRVQAWVLGSGVDPADPAAAQTCELITRALAGDEPAVVDAGALALVGPRAAPTVLTPHAGELAELLTRVTGREIGRPEVEAAPLPAAREAADRVGAVVVLKGATTLVVAPTAWTVPVRSQADAPAWLATAGAGDVLAGVIGTLLAAGLPALEAASLSVLVHGLAATRASSGGPLRALGVAQQLPATIADLLRR